MASALDRAEGSTPRLLFRQDGGSPDARETGAILDRLGIAFSGFTRLAYKPREHAADLRIEEVRIGSLDIVLKDVLETASAVLTLYEHRELLGGFVAQLNDAMNAMRRLGTALPMYRNAITAMSAPVRSGRATNVSLTVVGDNNRILIIDTVAADDIKRFLAAQPESGRGRNPKRTEIRRTPG